MILPMEHRTPSGLEIRMYPKEAKRLIGIKLDRNARDETDEELKARFARALAETDFDAIAKVYQIKDQKAPAPVVKPTRGRAPKALPPMKQDELLPSFLTAKK